jgi:hypothetical protein
MPQWQDFQFYETSYIIFPDLCCQKEHFCLQIFFLCHFRICVVLLCSILTHWDPSTKQTKIIYMTFRLHYLLQCLYGRPGGPVFVHQISCTVLHHSTNPTWYEEIKLRLPIHLHSRHHLLFTFYHISCEPSKKKESGIETCVGYAWLPLLQKGRYWTLYITKLQEIYFPMKLTCKENLSRVLDIDVKESIM